MIAASHIELVVAECNTDIIGCGYARIETAEPYLQHHRYAYLGFMYTLPAWRGKGINKMIIDALKNRSAFREITTFPRNRLHNTW